MFGPIQHFTDPEDFCDPVHHPKLQTADVEQMCKDGWFLDSPRNVQCLEAHLTLLALTTS